MRRCGLFVALALGACGDDGGGPTDAFVPGDFDNGVCGAQLRFTGEFVDWDVDKAFCGIFNATVQVQGGGASGSTAPNGRFDICISPDKEVTLVDITPSADPSECSQPLGGVYTLPAIAVANKTTILSGAFWSGRDFAMGRETIDATKAQVFVHVDGAQRAVSLTAAHGAVQANAATDWAPGDTGHDVFFPDVDPTGGSTTVSVDGGAVGTGEIPLVAGKMTEVTVLVH